MFCCDFGVGRESPPPLFNLFQPLLFFNDCDPFLRNDGGVEECSSYFIATILLLRFLLKTPGT